MRKLAGLWRRTAGPTARYTSRQASSNLLHSWSGLSMKTLAFVLHELEHSGHIGSLHFGREPTHVLQ